MSAETQKFHKGLIALVVCVVLAILAYTQLTIFVIQPIGAVPEGRTVVMLRLDEMQFIDSADAMCVRTQGYASVICRFAISGAVKKEGTVLMNLPYRERLYLISTGGKKYDF